MNITALCLTALPTTAFAANDYWIAQNGNWTQTSNWSTGKLPGTGDTARIESLTSETITLDTAQSIYALSVASNASSGQTSTTAINVLNQTAGGIACDDASIGGDLYGNGYLNQSGGTNNFNSYLIPGQFAGTFGEYDLRNTATVNITGTGPNGVGLYVGDDGTGVFNQSGGSLNIGSIARANFYLAYSPDATGTANFTGGTAITSGTAYIGGNVSGSGGKAVLNISNNGNFIVNNPLVIYNTSGTAVNLTGGTLQVASINTSSGSAARFNWTGGTLNVYNQSIDSTGSLGNALNITGTKSLDVPGTLVVGDASTGTITQNGSTVIGGAGTQGFMYIGYQPSGSGYYSLSGGPGVTLSASHEYVGYEGTAVFNQTGGTNTVSTTLDVAEYTGTPATYQMSAGILTAPLENIGMASSGWFNQSGGTNTVTTLNIAQTADLGVMNISGGSTIAGNVYVGGSSTAPGGTGILNINGTGSLIVSGTLTMYNVPSTALNLASGGTLTLGSLNFNSGSNTHFTWTGGTLNLTASSFNISSAVPSSTAAAEAWGFNSQGELGNGTTTTSTTPVMVSGLSTGVTAVAGGGSFALAIQNGAVFAWGNNRNGELGGSSLAQSSTPLAVTALSSGVTAIAAGGYHSLAVQNGAVYAWGFNGFGELGNGTVTDSNTPVPVSNLTSGVSAIAAGRDFSMALKNGAVYAWGSNTEGELASTYHAPSDIPVAITGLSTGVTTIAAGATHALAIQNGILMAWGNNSSGQLGIGSTTEADAPTRVSIATGVTAIAGGNAFSLAVQNGNVYAWGDNSQGQLGDGTTTGEISPEEIDPAQLSNIVSVAAGFASSYALAADGSVWQWGSNGDGDAQVPGSSTYSVTPQHMLPPTGYAFTAIDSDSNASFIVATLASVNSSLFSNLTLNTGMTLAITGSGQSVNLAGTLNINGGTLNSPVVNVSAGGMLNLSSGTINLTGLAGTAAAFNNSGTAILGGTQNYSAGTTFTNAAGATATFNSDAGSVAQLLNQTLNISSTNAQLNFNTSQHLASLTINGGSAQLNRIGSARSVLYTPQFTLTNSQFDLTNNDLDIQNGGSSALATATALVKQAYSNGTWTGNGLTSSLAASDTTHLTAVGVILNTSYTTLDGSAVAPNDVIAKYTYYGDANLDGKVDGSDYTLIDSGYLTHSTGWFNGDFNYDGVINGSDYTLIDNAFNRQGAALTNQIAAPTAQLASVPEPATAGLVSVITLLSVRRRRRQT